MSRLLDGRVGEVLVERGGQEYDAIGCGGDGNGDADAVNFGKRGGHFLLFGDDGAMGVGHVDVVILIASDDLAIACEGGHDDGHDDQDHDGKGHFKEPPSGFGD